MKLDGVDSVVRNADVSAEVVRKRHKAMSAPPSVATRDDPNTAPSKRVIQLHPSYRTPLDGTRAAQAVGIARMRKSAHTSMSGSRDSRRYREPKRHAEGAEMGPRLVHKSWPGGPRGDIMR